MIAKIREFLWNILSRSYPMFLRFFYGMDIAKTAVISRKAKLDKSINPKGIHIGEYSWITYGVVIMSHDYTRALKTDTYIGKKCFIGLNSIIMPGVIIGDEVVVASGSVVTKNIPSNCIVAGNPAKVIKEGINVSQKGQIC